jgi:predicted alpha/beta hydrolase family esterase
LKISETDILLIPGYGKTLPGHWLLRWQDKMPTARVVAQRELQRPNKKDWVDTLVKEVEACQRPVVLVAHSLGCILVAHAAHALKDKVRGAYLVAPSDWDRDGLVSEFDGGDFKPVPTHPLPSRAILSQAGTILIAIMNGPRILPTPGAPRSRMPAKLVISTWKAGMVHGRKA